jgi:hypothetical protein
MSAGKPYNFLKLVRPLKPLGIYFILVPKILRYLNRCNFEMLAGSFNRLLQPQRLICCKNFILPMFSGSLDVLVLFMDKYLKCLSRLKDSANASKFATSRCSARKFEKASKESPGAIFICATDISVLSDGACNEHHSTSVDSDPPVSSSDNRIYF